MCALALLTHHPGATILNLATSQTVRWSSPPWLVQMSMLCWLPCTMGRRGLLCQLSKTWAPISGSCVRAFGHMQVRNCAAQVILCKCS